MKWCAWWNQRKNSGRELSGQCHELFLEMALLVSILRTDPLTRAFERGEASTARAGSERAADRDIRKAEKQPDPAPLGARVSVRHRACGGDVVKQTPTLVARTHCG